MGRLADLLESINLLIGKVARWLILGMVLVQFSIVILRYVFSVSFVAMDECVLYMHASLFMLAVGYTLAVDQHVRVDIFYANFSDSGKRLLNCIGHTVLLFPSMALVTYYSWPPVRASWANLEGPITPGGIPAIFVLKSLIPAFCILLLIQGGALLLRDIQRLREGS